uniref:Uncharacterized protein n=1 Tax=Arundo donax TaxID=35708 RepID=A0A0A9HEN7_ARUDO
MGTLPKDAFMHSMLSWYTVSRDYLLLVFGIYASS